MSFVLLAGFVALLAAGLGCVLYTRLRVAAAARAHPPAGTVVGVPGRRCHVYRAPSGEGAASRPPILLIPGVLTNLEDLRVSLEERLSGRYRLVFVDRPGTGFSERQGRLSTPAGQAAAIAEALAGLDLPPAVVIGQSYGAAVALALALDHGHMVAGLVLSSPASHPFPGGIRWRYHALAAPVVGPLIAHTVTVPFGDLTARDGIAASFAPARPPADYVRRTAVALNYRPRDALNHARDVVDLEVAVRSAARRYGEIRVPTLILASQEDTVVSPRIHAGPLHHAIRGSRLVLLPGAGHNLHQTRPDRLAAEIDGFMGGLAAETGVAVDGPTAIRRAVGGSPGAAR